MPLQQETVTINFSSGLSTIEDPNQLAIGKFVALNNTVFIKANTGLVGSLKKRFGFTPLSATLSTVSFVANYSETLVGLGQGTVQQYSPGLQQWTSKGFYQPLGLNITSVVKNGYSQTQQDCTIAQNGVGCVAYNSGNPSAPYQYALFDSSTGQTISAPSVMDVVSSTTNVVGQPKVFNLGSNFCIVYGAVSSGFAITTLVAKTVNSYYPFTAAAAFAVDRSLLALPVSYVISSVQTSFTTAVFDGTIASDSVFLSYLSANSVSGSNMVGAKISPSLTVSSAKLSIGSFTPLSACINSCFDPSNSMVYTTLGYDAYSPTGSVSALLYTGNKYDFSSVFVSNPQYAAQTVGVGSAAFGSISLLVFNFVGTNLLNDSNRDLYGISNVSGVALNGTFQSFYEVATYSNAGKSLLAPFASRSDNIVKRPVTSSGVIGSETIVGPSLGLASKPFLYNGGIYLFGAYQSASQPTYFLINSTGSILSEFAYSNGGGYYSYGLPSVISSGSQVSVSFLQKDLIVPINTAVGSNNSFIQQSPFYSQTGINLANIQLSTSSISLNQTGNTLSMSGGFLWNYDGLSAFENNFLLGPDAFLLLQGTAVGSTTLFSQTYQYQVVYESTDAQGNVYRSTPGIATTATNNFTVGSGAVRAFVAAPMPRLTYRTPNNQIKVSLYRWSQLQPTFYKVGSLVYPGALSANTTSSLTSSLSVTSQATGNNNYAQDSVVFSDWTPDSLIVGNEILYTNGNIIEDSAAPSFIATTIFDERLWGISAEDGSLWYSKQLVKNTPVEMSGNFALYVPPIQTSQGSGQSPLCLATMDEKLIILCKSSLLYIAGTGPDDTGAGSQYSQPTPIPSQVGCSNIKSIVQTPNGLMFQTDNGIWLLGRDLSVKFIGKDVEAYNAIPVTSAACVPGTGEVRFSLNNGTRLVYDLLADQWTTFSGISVQSGAIVSGKDTVVSTTGQVFQESSTSYLDGTTPVTMNFTTGWINLAGLQGYARAYWINLLGTFQSPHTYSVGIAYDYNPAIVQTTTINPFNVTGSGSSVEQWQIGFQRQQCQSFQLTFTETSSGTAGAGVVISAMSLTYGKKKSYAANLAPKSRV